MIRLMNHSKIISILLIFMLIVTLGPTKFVKASSSTYYNVNLSVVLNKATVYKGSVETVNATSNKASYKVQYRAFYYHPIAGRWASLTKGYLGSVVPTQKISISTRTLNEEGAYRIIVLEKKAGTRGIRYSKQFGYYDNYKTLSFNVKNPPENTVCIDAGHGGDDSGAVGTAGVKEKDVNLAVALKVGSILQQNNINVVYTRTNDNPSWDTSDQSASLSKRCSIANNAKADIFVAIHCNSADDVETANGTETYSYATGTNGEKLANLIQSELIKATGAANRGVKTANFYVLKNTSMPAVLTELGFLSNATEEKKLNDATYQQKCANGIAKAIIEYLN